MGTVPVALTYSIEIFPLSQHFSVQQLFLPVITVKFASTWFEVGFAVPLECHCKDTVLHWQNGDCCMTFGQLTPTPSLYKVVCGASKREVCRVSVSYAVCLYYVSWGSDSGAKGSEELAFTIFRLVLEETTVQIVAAHSSKASNCLSVD